MNLDFLKGNPALNDISPEKLQFLMDFASNNTDAKDAKSMASTVMNAANNAKQNGMTFSNTETTLLIELLKQNMSEAERVKADKMLQMMQMLQKEKIVSYNANEDMQNAHPRLRNIYYDFIIAYFITILMILPGT